MKSIFYSLKKSVGYSDFHHGVWSKSKFFKPSRPKSKLPKEREREFDGVPQNTYTPYFCKDRAMWRAAGSLGPSQVFLHCRFFPGLPDDPVVT